MLQLIQRIMEERGVDLRLEKEVVEAAMEKVEGEIQTAKTCGVGGLLMTLESTPCLVSWRRVCGILHAMMVDKNAYHEVNSARRRRKSHTRLPALLENSREIYEIGFDMIVGMADLEQMSIEAVMPMVPLLVQLAKNRFFKLNNVSIKLLENMLSSCRSSLSQDMRAAGCSIMHSITSSIIAEEEALRTGVQLPAHGQPAVRPHTKDIVTSRCPDALYLIAFFDESKELREKAKACLNNLSLDTSKPPDVMHWGTREVMMWLSTSLKFENSAMSDFIRERIDGPALLALSDVLVGRLESLTVKHCIDLLNAVEQLKMVQKSWTGYELFFSYRRQTGSALVLLYALQMRSSFNCFIDLEGDSSNNFSEQLERRISECHFFVPFFTDVTIKSLNDPNDLMKREIMCAQQLGRTIIPIYYHIQPPSKEQIPTEVRRRRRYLARVPPSDRAPLLCTPLGRKTTGEDSETPPVPVGSFWSVSLDVCVGNLPARGSVSAWGGWCVLSRCCVCVRCLSSVELCDVLSLGRWPGVLIMVVVG